MSEQFRRTILDRVRLPKVRARVAEWVGDHRRATIVTSAGAGIAALLIVALLVTSKPPAATVHDASRAPQPSEDDRPSPAALADGDWRALTLPPYEPVATLLASATEGHRIDPRTAFTLQSLTSTPAAELAEGLVVEPAVELRISAAGSPHEVVVEPTAPLLENARYAFRLQDETGALLDEWSFRTSGPLNVVGRIPEHQSTQVPTDTGIEIQFDQDGVVGFPDAFTIEPTVDGRFEQHGRTWVFVPTDRLAAATVYTVTVGVGVHVEGSDDGLAAEVTISFETAASGSAANDPGVIFERALYEVRPGDPTVIPIVVSGDSGSTESFTRPVKLYDLGSTSAAVDVATTLARGSRWAIWSSDDAIETDSLRLAGSFDAVVWTRWGEQRIELPALDAGFYLLDVEEPRRHAQLVLQVTNLAAYLLSSDAQVLAWVNDLATDSPVGGASVSLADGTDLGQTASDGLLDAGISRPLQAELDGFSMSGPEPNFAVVRAPDGSEVIAALGAETAWYFGQQASSQQWWSVLGTDRLRYRSDDTIHAWGYLKARADRSVPDDVELRLLAGWDPYAPPIARQSVSPTPRGTIVGDLPVDDLPPGQYSVALFAGDDSIAQASITVTEIRKPSFKVALETPRHAYIDGETIEASVAARFFDGTPVPGIELRLEGSGVDPSTEQVVKMGPDGTAQLTFEATTSLKTQDSGMLHASPVSAQEGASFNDVGFSVFPSSAWISAAARVYAGMLTISGVVSTVDLADADRQFVDHGWVEDPSGDPLGGRSVSATVDRVTWIPKQNGTSYDFLEKRAVPTYEYERNVQRVATLTALSTADGAFDLATPFDATSGAGAEVTLSVTDEQGRVTELMTYASEGPGPLSGATDFPYLEQRQGCGWGSSITAELDETYALTVRSGDGAPDAAGRTLFAISRGGIDEVVITSAAGIERVFGDLELPSVVVRAVRLTPAGYIVMGDMTVRVNADDKRINLALEPNRDRYAPGDEVSVAVKATDADGRPISTDVVIQAVDAKLYDIGAAGEVDTSTLMLPLGSGFSAAYATHQVEPPVFGDGCGAATGGGEEPRSEFKDNATFQLIQTGTDGRGTVTFDAPDDLTSWVVSAAAFSDNLDAGTASVEVPVGLPFFVDAVIAPEYLAGEEPVIHLSAHGDALTADDTVTFTVEAPTLGLDETVSGSAFEQARVALPPLPLGDHLITIRAEGPRDTADALERAIRVVPTRLRTLQTSYATVGNRFEAPGGDGMTTYSISDAGRGALVPVLQQLAWSASARLDASLAAELARRILIDDFGLAETGVPASGWNGIAALPPEGLALFPHASGDLVLTARAALVSPDQLPLEYVSTVLTSALADDPTRDRAIVALAGLAGIGRDVLAQLRSIEVDDLSVREQAWLALGLAAGGDQDAARAIERSILSEHGQRLGSWVRLDTGDTTPEAADATATLLLLAAGLRDPLAVDISRYLLENPSRKHVAALEQIGFARAALEWLPRAAAHFTWIVDGERHEETLEPGAAMSITLTPAQRESFELEAIDGELFVTSSWQGNANYDELANDGSVTIERSISPADHAPADDLVHVSLKVRFSDSLNNTCYQVTDLLPSGLAPVAQTAWWDTDPSVILPYEVEGQRVSWCILPTRSDVSLGYAARVVSAGAYRWEPAVVQALAAPEVGAATTVITYTID